MPYGTKEVTTFIVDDPQEEARGKGSHTDHDCPPHVFPCFCILYASVEQVYTSRENQSSQSCIGNLMKCRILDVHVNGGDGDGGKHERRIDAIRNYFRHIPTPYHSYHDAGGPDHCHR